MILLDLSIIIVNYNTFNLTVQCINSILVETTGINYEIIVVDNASTDQNVEDLKFEFPTIQLIKNTTNAGFGIANNMGMKAAKGNCILLLNSDTIIIDKGITKSLAYLQQHTSTIDVLTCQQLNEEGKPFMPKSFYFKSNHIFQYLVQNPIVELIKSKINPTKTSFITSNTFVENLSGAFMLLKKEVFEKTNGFDPDFFIYYEETEWCMRIKKQFKLFYLHDVNFIHLHGKSAPRLIMQKQMHLSGGLFWYKKGYFTYFLFLFISYIFYLPSWFLLTLISLKPATRNHFFKYVKIYVNLLPYFLFQIPKHRNGFHQRKESLKLFQL
ncbi:MAG: hypothetical protein A3K10_08575 [Bacteroidetes bacterium RIFCSPLOWO2_12_FULL_31_6]|nr:MAG: hypothetical protein A3K10_08575 [Bacteroidetes bacterium RIFCSPLOWO2_12_FULL_31_6]